MAVPFSDVSLSSPRVLEKQEIAGVEAWCVVLGLCSTGAIPIGRAELIRHRDRFPFVFFLCTKR